MSDVDKMIVAWKRKIEEHDRASNKIKQMVNDALELEGRPPMYSDADLQSASAPSLHFRPDAFFGKPLASCVRMILEQRQALNQGAASQDDLHGALIAGGFDFEDKRIELAKRNLAISLGKNMLFQRTPNGLWGLREWYGVDKKNKQPKGGAESGSGTASPTNGTQNADDGEDA